MSEQQQRVIGICQQYQAVLLEQSETHIKVALAAKPSEKMLDALHFASQRRVDVESWPQNRIDQYLQDLCQNEISLKEDHRPPKSAVSCVEHILMYAWQRRASDIHIEPQEDVLGVRLRIDGVLQKFQEIRGALQRSVVARIKILGNLDIAERRVPQDGQFSMTFSGKQVAFRLSTLPTHFGEKMVLRLLQGEKKSLELEKLGMPADLLNQYRAALFKPQGLILVTGPTGSGKTFTLYNGLNALNCPSRNLTSVEDPIEIPLPGINQTQVNPKIGLDFHRVLRALLRQDPDVIMIGEIRDSETAEIAVKAAQTGHLVLSTLHTNSALETLTRLRQIGIPGYLLGSALTLVIAQRLIRKLCQHCRKMEETVISLPKNIWPPGTLQTWSASGCENCFSGYYGRLALFELLPISDKVRCAIIDGADLGSLAALALQQGMRTLLEEGLTHANSGETSLEEVYRVIGHDEMNKNDDDCHGNYCHEKDILKNRIGVKKRPIVGLNG